MLLLYVVVGWWHWLLVVGRLVGWLVGWPCGWLLFVSDCQLFRAFVGYRLLYAIDECCGCVACCFVGYQCMSLWLSVVVCCCMLLVVVCLLLVVVAAACWCVLSGVVGCCWLLLIIVDCVWFVLCVVCWLVVVVCLFVCLID